MNKKVITIGLVICPVIFAVYVIFSIYGSPIEKVKFNKECQKYLAETYNENMKIINVDYSYKSRRYFANISLDNTDVRFTVEKCSGKLIDDYFIEYWKYETSNDITRVVTSVYGTDKGTGNLYFTQDSPISSNVYKMEKKIPSFLSVRNKFDTSIFGYIYISTKFNSVDYLDEYEKIYQVIKYVFETYSPDDVTIEYSDNTKFRIEIEEFKQLENKINIQNYKQH